ncbi:hypothetical protein OKJ48_12430 [Streptomyces kunmingensis]|uniref:DUF8094 domain-containing protein n=1 Tax=Streptomyces kunmingensis TaxID=68225 RepID=A0ABU6C8K9_9ACTN|nr:hypothetical protein [Streptomyces kunmingensis]MEB3961045.1 hypothetical protein [Streptomyces kunmingensis]
MSDFRIGLGRPAAAAAAAVVLSLTASGCVTVHGELEVMPTTTKTQAARALDTFVTAYNKADKTYDRAADAKYVSGALAAIDAAKLKAGRAVSPEGNTNHKPLKLSDTNITVPKKAGWPRWFVTDSANSRIPSSRWVMVFTRDAVEEPWAVSYLTVFRGDTLPEFKKDADGWGEAVAADAGGLAVRPGDLGEKYATYLKDGGDGFADGAYTSEWRASRKKNESRPGLTTQFIDEPLKDGDYAPIALRTEDGGALVFFATRRFEKQTAFSGSDLPAISPSVKALMSGDAKQSATYGFVSNQAAVIPGGGSAGGAVQVLNRVEGITTAEGS